MVELKVIEGSPKNAYETLSITLKSLEERGQYFFMGFVGSPDKERSEESWCSDCNIYIKTYKNLADGLALPGIELYLVYVGSREEWKKKDNPFKINKPKINTLPTFIVGQGNIDNIRDEDRLTAPIAQKDLENFLLHG